MCCACEPRLPALKMPQVPHRAQPTGPQYFTFDPLPEVETSSAYKKSSRSNRIKKRSRRVLYPPVVKRYYPTEERSFAKRLLFILLAIVFFQIYSAEEDLSLAVASSGAGEGLFAASGAQTREARCEASLLEQPATAERSWEMAGAANATGGQRWGNREASASAIIDITQFLLQSRAAF
ncbi:radiation-inducible immediate-early gene IEX-1 [Eublepharis macularius]|uniref:Radiation-inducible immediate-early gene IEX-1 n=1 Tax=Eublepharis macularius TaxID=481883 RepID=A0AA97KXE8_EUBMA|nr:radiation-inducible immediate-early gene IEX-1 [Eublepharis macularius]